MSKDIFRDKIEKFLRTRERCRLAEMSLQTGWKLWEISWITIIPTFYIFTPLLRKIRSEDEGKETDEGERERERWGVDGWTSGRWWNGSYFGNLGSQEWAEIVLTPLFSHSIMILIINKYYEKTIIITVIEKSNNQAIYGRNYVFNW